MLKNLFKSTKERKEKLSFKLWNVFVNIMPLIAIIIGAHLAWKHKKAVTTYQYPKSSEDYFYANKLKIVGDIEANIDIFKIPKLLHPMGKFLLDVLPLTLISFMESYSVARRIAVSTNELHILHPNQEFFAVGVSNLLGSVSSAYPTSGSFSRSALNHAAGAKTPLSKLTTLFVVLIVLGTLTESLYYIPNAALAAVIFLAINSLIKISDFWEAWKYSKQDFFVLSVTWVFTFTFETSIGLAIGLLTSALVALGNYAFSEDNKPMLLPSFNELGVVEDDVKIVALNGDLSFVTAPRIKDFVGLLILEPVAEAKSDGFSDRCVHTIHSTLDSMLKPKLPIPEFLPRLIVLDFTASKSIDITGLQTLSEIVYDVRRKNIKISFINVPKSISFYLEKYGVHCDPIEGEVLRKIRSGIFFGVL
jgi:SulP family sulfate permease